MKIRKFSWLALLAFVHLAQTGAEARDCNRLSNKMAGAKSIVAKQLAMSQQTWARLLRHGVTEHTSLRLDFFYASPTQSAAQCLVDVLKTETDYDVQRPSAVPDGTWKVSGSTKPTHVSPAVLDEWVKWMVVAGIRSGGSVFDGWGTELPTR